MIKLYIYLSTFICLVFVILFLAGITTFIQFISFILAITLNLINSLLAQHLFRNSLKKGNKQFIIWVLGGMGLRMLFLLSLFAFIIIFLKIDNYAFIFTFLIIYFVSLVWQISTYLKDLKKTKSV